MYAFADNLQEAGNLEAAGHKSREALDSELKELRGLEKKEELTRDAFDLELLANLYRVLGDVYSKDRKYSEALTHDSAAVFMAYVFLLTEEVDKYSCAVYDEMVDRTTDHLNSLLAGKPANRQAFIEGCEREQQFWGLIGCSKASIDFKVKVSQADWCKSIRENPNELARLLFPVRPEDGDAIAAILDNYGQWGPEFHARSPSQMILPHLFTEFVTLLCNTPDRSASDAPDA